MGNIPFTIRCQEKKKPLCCFIHLYSPPFLHVWMLQRLDFASTNSSFVLVLCQFCGLVCLLAQTPVAGVVTLELTFTTTQNWHNELVLPVPPDSHVLLRARSSAATVIISNVTVLQMEILKHTEVSDLPVVARRSTGETRENTGFWQSKIPLSHFPRLLYYSTLSPHTPKCSFPYNAADNKLIW